MNFPSFLRCFKDFMFPSEGFPVPGAGLRYTGAVRRGREGTGVRGQRYLLFVAPPFGTRPTTPPVLVGLFEEKSLVINSETSGNSWLGLSMFIDCSIS